MVLFRRWRTRIRKENEEHGGDDILIDVEYDLITETDSV